MACAGACWALGRVAPFPEVRGIHPKWEYFRERRDQFDVLFIGSSRFYHQIIPAQFDAAAAAAGVPVHSFNFGYDGMWPPESFYLLRQILELRPGRLKWVVIDFMDIDTRLDVRNNSTLRMAYWHDWRHTCLVVRELLRSPRNERFDLLFQHGRMWFSQALNLGRGAEIVARRLYPPPPRKKPFGWESQSGFSAGEAHGLVGRQREEFLRIVTTLPERIRPVTLRPVFRDALAEMITEVRAAGAQPIMVIAPTLDPHQNFATVPCGAPLIALNDPVRYPALFDPENRYDTWHLNEKGAVHFTDLLAQRFIEQVRLQP